MIKITRLFLLTILIQSLLLVSIDAYSQAGSLDQSFGNNGIALFDINGYHDNGNDIKALDNGTMLVTGAGNVATYESNGYIMKILDDGTQDMSWGTNGVITFDYGEDTFPYTMEILSDGKILISGTVYVTVSDAEFFVSRFNSDGTPDATFGTNGVFISSYSTSEDVCNTMAIQPDGKIVLAGRTYLGSFTQLLFSCVHADGTLDTSFGTNGYTEIDASVQDERINGLAFLSSGSIVGVGYGYQSTPWYGDLMVIAKLNPDGSPMTSFGGDGVIIPGIATNYSRAFQVESKNDSLFVTGQISGASGNDLFLAKLDSSAVADPSFGINGMATISINQTNTGLDILTTGDGKVYVSGTTGMGGPSARDFFLLRYLHDGSLDTSFNGIGYVTTTIRADWDEANALDMQPDGKVICTGMSGGLTTSGNNDIPVTRYLNDYLPSGLIADFSSSTVLTCENDPVDFTDLSYSTDSTVLTWQWTFEGGTPATSTVQNPSVTYATAGVFDVQLIVYDGIFTDTILAEDYITIEAVPIQTATPTGPTDVCNSFDYDYTTNSVQFANEYDWEVSPSDAGVMVGTDTAAVFETSGTWSGTCYIKVRAEGMCGTGEWSADLVVELRDNPVVFVLTGEGAYCTGSSGSELILDGSETGVDYELYLDEVTTGVVLAGTGDSLNFGFYTDEGLYTVTAYTDYCTQDMIGQIYVHEEFPPAQPSMPAGPEDVCNSDTTTYTTTTVSGADNYVWSLNPPESGELFPDMESVDIAWSIDFSGTALLSVQSENECGLSDKSEALSIEVLMIPSPEIIGSQLVCDDEEEGYETTENAGNTYVWEVIGGEIVSGTGTSQIIVLWGAPGDGSVSVSEESPEGCTGFSEEFDVVIDECIGIGESALEEVKLYPNPASKLLTVDLSSLNGTEVNIKILNTVGALIETIEVDNAIQTVNTSTYENGVYFMQIITDSEIIINEIFVVRN